MYRAGYVKLHLNSVRSQMEYQILYIDCQMLCVPRSIIRKHLMNYLIPRNDVDKLLSDQTLLFAICLLFALLALTCCEAFTYLK